MQTVFRVKRHWDAKQLTGLKLAKRRRLGGDVPVILTYAGTAPNNESKTALSVIKSHLAQCSNDTPKENNLHDESNCETNAAEKSPGTSTSYDITDSDVDDLFKIYDAYQNSITTLDSGVKKSAEVQTDHKEDGVSKFVYDIYYVRQQSPSGSEPISIDYNELDYTLERWSPVEEELVNERADEDQAECFEDEDSNAEDNPNNDYPDEEDCYSNNGEEIRYSFNDDDYYGDERYSHLSSIEQQLQDLSFHGYEASD